MRKYSVLILLILLISACSPPPKPVVSEIIIEGLPETRNLPSSTETVQNCGGNNGTIIKHPSMTVLTAHTVEWQVGDQVGIGAKIGESVIPGGVDLSSTINSSISLSNGSGVEQGTSWDLPAEPNTIGEYTLSWREVWQHGYVNVNLANGQTLKVNITYRTGIKSDILKARKLICPSGQAVTPVTLTVSGEITIWHAYGTGSAEEIALSNIINHALIDIPNIKIHVVQIPFGDIYNKYSTDVAAGNGPDMFIVPNDSLGDEARAGLIADITQLAAGKLGNYSQLSIDGMSVNGRLYGIPESQKAVVFWYNKGMLPNPPATTDELRTLMERGTPIGISFGCYHHFGFFGAFGGKVFDNNWNFIADQGNGITNAMNYLNGLYQISKSNGWPTTDSDGFAPFAEGRVVGVTNGNWAMGDYKNALGNNLGVAPLPAGPNGPAAPMLGIDGFYFNPNSTNKEAALEVALYLTNKQSQTIMMNEAGHVPVNTTVDVTDPLIKGLIAAFKNGYIRPQDPQLGKYWGNFCGTDQVFEAGIPAANWVREANANAQK